MPERLAANRPPSRFYRGGARITAFRGEGSDAPREPEDWVASTTTVAGETKLGLTRLSSGVLLRDSIDLDPAGWLGDEHVRRWGSDARLLVKLLDAGERLPVHAHPDDDFAATHLGRAHGKAEAWYILEGGPVYIGLRDGVDRGRLRQLVDRQDVDGLLALLHRVEVASGDVVWVPPGELHAIGSGVMLLELQQPEDLSILLEWTGFALDGRRDGHLGLGFDLAVNAVTTIGRSAADLEALVRPAPPRGSCLPDDAAAYFRLERRPVTGPEELEQGFAVVVVTAGSVTVGDLAADAGSTLLVAAREGVLPLGGSGEVLVARPPAP